MCARPHVGTPEHFAHPRGIHRQHCQTELMFSALSFRKYHFAATRAINNTLNVKRKSAAASPGLLGSVVGKYEPN